MGPLAFSDFAQVGIDWYLLYQLVNDVLTSANQFKEQTRPLAFCASGAGAKVPADLSGWTHLGPSALCTQPDGQERIPRRKQTIKVVFAGSSESSLRRMFGRATEPFYNWAPIEPFERLGAAFVTAMTQKVNQLSRYPLSERESMRAFEALKRTPEFFRRYLQRYLAYAELGSRAALDDTLAHVFNDSGYRTAWGRLLPADKAVLRALAQGVSDLHSLPARKRLGEELGLGKPAPLDTPKNALRRLQKEEFVVKLE